MTFMRKGPTEKNEMVIHTLVLWQAKVLEPASVVHTAPEQVPTSTLRTCATQLVPGFARLQTLQSPVDYSTEKVDLQDQLAACLGQNRRPSKNQVIF